MIKVSMTNSKNQDNKVSLDRYLKSFSLSQSKENYKSTLELEVVLIDELLNEKNRVSTGNLITVTEEDKTIFEGTIINFTFSELKSLKLSCYSKEWSFENTVVSSYLEEVEFRDGIKEILSKFNINLKMNPDTSIKDSTKKVTKLFLKRNLVDVIKDILKESTDNDYYLNLENLKSAELLKTPRSKYKKSSHINKTLGDEVLKYLTSATYSEDVSEMKNSLIVPEDNPTTSNGPTSTLKNASSIKSFGLHQALFNGGGSPKQYLEDISSQKKKLELAFFNVSIDVLPFDTISFTGDKISDFNKKVFEVTNIKKSISNSSNKNNVKYTTSLTLEEITV